MRKLLLAACLAATGLTAEVHTHSLREAVRIALQQNPEVAQARLDETVAEQAVRIVRGPFTPTVAVGSGLAYTSGFPLSIEGSAPSLFQGQASRAIFNRPLTYQVARARERARGAQIDTAAVREDVAFRTASLCLDILSAASIEKMAAQQIASQEQVGAVVRERVREDRELPLEEKRAALGLAQARHQHALARNQRDYLETSLAGVLGYAPGDRVQVIGDEPVPAGLVPPTEEAAQQAALEFHPELRRLQSEMVANEFEIRSHRAARLPRVDLVAQYALLTRFNNYDLFFNHFQRHNGQVGVSVQLPLLTGSDVQGQLVTALAGTSRLRSQINSVRSRVSLEARRLFQDLNEAESSREIARLALDLSREELSVLLAQFEEGRIGLREVESARFAEAEYWIDFYESQAAVQKARYAVLRHTGGLMAALH